MRHGVAMDERAGLEQGWLGQEPDEFRSMLHALARFRTVQAGQSVYASADHADALLGVAAGHLALRTPLVSGEEIVVHVCSPGFFLGVTMISSRGQRRHLGAHARTETTLAVIPLSTLRRTLHEQPQFWPSAARLMELHWALTACIARDLLLRKHRDRIVATLLRLVGLRPDPPTPAPDLRSPVTHEEIAAMTNCSASLVHAELRRLQVLGWIELAYGSIRVLAPDSMLASLKR